MAVLTPAEAAGRLQKEYREGRLIPFLGAGFSKPLNLPSWSELMGWMAKRLGFEPELFELHGTYPQLAEFLDLARHDALKSFIHEMTVQLDSLEARRKRRSSITHKALAELDFRTIYTTNYEAHIEGALEDAGKKYAVLASLEDFQAEREPGSCELIKFHGTLSDPETLVLTESSYFERMRLEGAADQRLRSDLLSNSFLFIGYSFSDSNIRYIWYRMHQMRRAKSQPRRCFFTTFARDPVQPVLLDRWNIDVIVLDPIDKSKSVADLLNSLR